VTSSELKTLLDEKVNRDDFYDMRTQFNKMNLTLSPLLTNSALMAKISEFANNSAESERRVEKLERWIQTLKENIESIKEVTKSSKDLTDRVYESE